MQLPSPSVVVVVVVLLLLMLLRLLRLRLLPVSSCPRSSSASSIPAFSTSSSVSLTASRVFQRCARRRWLRLMRARLRLAEEAALSRCSCLLLPQVLPSVPVLVPAILWWNCCQGGATGGLLLGLPVDERGKCCLPLTGLLLPWRWWPWPWPWPWRGVGGEADGEDPAADTTAVAIAGLSGGGGGGGAWESWPGIRLTLLSQKLLPASDSDSDPNEQRDAKEENTDALETVRSRGCWCW